MVFKHLVQLLLSSTLTAGSAAASLDLQQPLAPHHDVLTVPSYRADLLILHKHLVEIPSTSGLEHNAGAFLVDYFTSKSWSYEVQPVPPRPNTPSDEERFNIIAWPPSERSSTGPKPKVLVTSHIDCVPPHIPYSIEEGDVTRSTTISGRCSVDAKGSVAAQLTAVHELLSSGSLAPEDIMVLYVVGEEINGDGMKAFSALNSSSLNIRAAVFGEPTENKLACGHKGALRCDVTARGKAAHSGYPWQGKSANEVLMRAMVKVLDADLGSSERYGNTTVNVGMMEGGVALNVIPAHAQANLMCRIAVEPQQTGHEIVVQRISEILKDVDDEALSLDCPVGQGVTPCDCDVEGFDTLVANYGTDIPYLEGDHTRYLYGPGTILVAHGDDEALTVGDLETAVEGYKKLILHSLEI
ncbi:Zn-dependent exopeptidase [Cryphonectria parasitica EP155]|uniref:Zn-dependent exopeptidase n=1 Tax=Cryphonectria parasitica (strain ATCC 38755 / EP155) TaxID=660469 RepID=A0A9P5CME5_CRYP1|nr:Zn-dependent exopeptidase [Cryphonectria parasitica EP155]KAF3762815.1 Zn-dependent exopeptidase [Cryphonectria parasitica EP155]